LNYDSEYVKRNVMIDNEETTLNKKSSYVVNVLGYGNKMPDESHYFVPKELVYHYVARLMKSNKAFKYGIELQEKNKTEIRNKRKKKDLLDILMRKEELEK